MGLIQNFSVIPDPPAHATMGPAARDEPSCVADIPQRVSAFFCRGRSSYFETLYLLDEQYRFVGISGVSARSDGARGGSKILQSASKKS